MDARFYGLDNILETLGIRSNKNFELWYETALQGRETMELNTEGFEWADAQLDFTYEFLEAEGHIRAMANYVDLGSEPLARGKNVELKKLTGSIPRQRRKIVQGENDYRKQMIALQNADAVARLRGDSPYNSVREYLARNLFDTLSEIPDSHNASLSYQVGQMKSNRMLSLTDENNAGGIVGVDFKANVPAENVVDQDWYTVDDEGNVTYVEDVDPIEILKKKIRSIKLDPYRGYRNVCVELNASTLFTLIEHPKVLRRIGYGDDWKLTITARSNNTDKADAAAIAIGRDKLLSNSDEFVKNWFVAAIGADQLIVDTTIVGVDRLNTVTKRFDTAKLDTFNDGVILVRPTGTIGKIFNVTPLRPDGSAISAGIFGNRGIIEYRYNAETRTQTWVSELTVLAVPTMPKKLFYYNIKGKTETAQVSQD
jgi:hypothetical protein